MCTTPMYLVMTIVCVNPLQNVNLEAAEYLVVKTVVFI